MDVRVVKGEYVGNGNWVHLYLNGKFVKNFTIRGVVFSVVKTGSGKVIVSHKELLKLNPHLNKYWENKKLEDWL